MDSIIFVIGSAFWLGVLTSISPCPLATNVAAISYVSRNLSSPVRTILTGFLYAFGRAFVYLGLALIIMKSIGFSSTISNFLQMHFNKIVGPILILVGMYLVELITFNFLNINLKSKIDDRFNYNWIIGPVILGIIFALSFCPVSAALFFGGLIPLAVENNSFLIIPILYGFGTALPVIVLSIIINTGVKSAAKNLNVLVKYEKWMRFTTGTIFILVGVYFSLIYIFKLNI